MDIVGYCKFSVSSPYHRKNNDLSEKSILNIDMCVSVDTLQQREAQSVRATHLRGSLASVCPCSYS